MASITSIVVQLPAAILAVIIGAIMNLVAVSVFNAIGADYLYYILLGLIDVAATIGIIKKLLD